jgi:peptidoglycan/LPS O-acetylase OafA/YrhL
MNNEHNKQFALQLQRRSQMTETEALKVNTGGAPSRRLLRSVGAVFSGLVVVFVLSLGTDVVLHATGIFPPWFKPMSTPLWVFTTSYRLIYGIAGGYIAARLAPSKPMRHALALGFVGLALSIAGTVGTWNQGPEFGPRWYPLALVVTALPCAWFGGWLQQNLNR